jgi:hypothetical protein
VGGPVRVEISTLRYIRRNFDRSGLRVILLLIPLDLDLRSSFGISFFLA